MGETRAQRAEREQAEQEQAEREQAEREQAEQNDEDTAGSPEDAPPATEGSDRGATEVSTVGGKGVAKDEGDLTNEEVVQRRTSMPNEDLPLDGKYRRFFVIPRARVSTRNQDAATSDWRAPEYDAMHQANFVQVLQEALNKGLSPRSEVELEKVEEGEDADVLTYAVPVVPTSRLDPEAVAAAHTPSFAIGEMGGSTLPEFAEGEDKRD